MAVVVALTFIGSDRLVWFDAALVGYLFGVVFAVFGVIYDRDPDLLQLVVRADPSFTDVALAADRPAFIGTRQQVADDIHRVGELGATELILDLQSSTRDVDELMSTAIRLSEPHRALVAA